MDSDQQPSYLSVRETARRLGVHENTVRNWAAQGVLVSARIAGSRFHRFDERDVERLRQQRGAVVSTVEPERRTVGPELIDASQLHQWAKTRDAQDLFPELMRRLLSSTPGVTNVSVRSGDGVALGGWDGRADAHGAAFLPNGHLAFEFGVGAAPKGKADDDYQKRRADPLGVTPSDTCFVFATPRRWGAGPQWEAAHRADGVFAGVRVLDADDLEGWLQATPAVHYWVSERLHRNPRDAETLEHWWDRFRGQTTPFLPSSLFIAGRDRESAQLEKILAGPPVIIAVESAWDEDAKAFVQATVRRMAEAGRPAQPVLLVSSLEVWDRVIDQNGRMTLIPLFDKPNVAAAQARGHHVVLIADHEYAVSSNKIVLSRPQRGPTDEALQAAGIGADQAYKLAALARRSLPSLVRKLARDARVARPDWSRVPLVNTFGPLVLVGSWTQSEKDISAVERTVRSNWADIERQLVDRLKTDDPPFVRPGGQWHLASAEEAFLLINERLTSDDLKHWHEIAVDVLTEPDPILDMPLADRQMAGLRGVGRQFSSTLRRGFAEGTALLGSLGPGQLSDGVSGQDHARKVVGAVLAKAASDSSGKSWQSLADILPLLAEAAPQLFLDAVIDDLDLPEPLLPTLFQDRDDTSWMFSSSPHTGLLWALETLCWSPEYLLEAAAALAALQKVDPGGRLSNRPLASLTSVFVGWIKHTGASIDTKTSALEQICARYPDIGWQLLKGLWPNHHDVSSPPSQPRFRDWKPEDQSVSMAEWISYVGSLTTLAIDLAADDLERWGDLAGRIAQLPSSDRERILAGLESKLSDDLSSDRRLALWEAIHAEVLKHERFASADWAMDAASLARLREVDRRLEPITDPQRYAYLFNWHPDLPSVDELDYENYRTKLQALRTAAVKDALHVGSFESLTELARKVPVPNQLGITLGEMASDELTPSLLAWLDSKDSNLREVAQSWARRCLAENDAGWLRECLARPEMAHGDRRKIFARCAPATSDAWDILADIDAELADAYWLDVQYIAVSAEDMERAVHELVRHGRSWVAVELLSHAASAGDPAGTSLTPQLAVEAIEGALKDDIALAPSSSVGYGLGQLLDYLDRADHPSEKLIGYEFIFFRLLENYRKPKALYAGLANSPGLFVDLVKRVYRGKDEPRRALDEHEQALANLAWGVLRSWRGYPGRQEDGTMDVEAMKKWVADARLALADADRPDIGDEVIGQAFAGSPPGSDGIWPAEPVREVIEAVGSQSLATGFHVGIINSRGVTSRSPYDGGQQERNLADKYAGWAKATAARWPRTSRILRGLAESYERDAQREDARAEVVADTQ
jgi:excisionase family DNA binding protein